jgi:hypothetical protein
LDQHELDIAERDARLVAERAMDEHQGFRRQ